MIEKRLNDKGKNYRHVAKVRLRNARNVEYGLSVVRDCLYWTTSLRPDLTELSSTGRTNSTSLIH